MSACLCAELTELYGTGNLAAVGSGLQVETGRKEREGVQLSVKVKGENGITRHGMLCRYALILNPETP
ncbi:hypothetical protein E2C01_016792 [Portunus trituberculatus]|uniref:Uncharacterized protein n=1 Tax=Portunus trituberculatus TaxID=210409 RepID=A0A5B7DQ04_PORTR|nr:hypothetical protein [Portunus trituberculatus]